MIEIIREEDWNPEQEKSELPKNIKQIGTPDIGDRIYIENQVHQYMHPYDTLREKTVYVLLGKFDNFGGRQCVFVEAAICLEEIEFDGELPIWNDDSWSYLYKKLKHAYDDMVITGWAMDIRGQLPNLTVALERLHRTYFGGAHQILYLMDSLEKEDAFYGLKNGYLKRREGYYIYYDKSIPERLDMAMQSLKEEKKEKEEKESVDTLKEDASILNDYVREDAKENGEEQQIKRSTPSYRSYLRQNSPKRTFLPSYATSLVLFLVICGLGYAAFMNYQKMNAMESALMKMSTVQAASTESGTVKVESVAGSVLPETESEETTAPNLEISEGTTMEESANVTTEATKPTSEADGTATTQTSEEQTNTTAVDTSEPTSTSETTTETMSESQMYLSQGYYIVQKGDSLVGICRRIYQTTAMMDELCEVNGIEDPDAIYEGQTLKLPN